MVYVLPLSEQRHAHLNMETPFVEPIPTKGASVNEIVMVKKRDELTHVAIGRRNQGKITLSQVHPLSKVIPTMRIPALVPKRLIGYAIRVFNSGGVLPPKTAEATVSSLIFLRPELKNFVNR